jgi:hypothetical protein
MAWLICWSVKIKQMTIPKGRCRYDLFWNCEILVEQFMCIISNSWEFDLIKTAIDARLQVGVSFIEGKSINFSTSGSEPIN